MILFHTLISFVLFFRCLFFLSLFPGPEILEMPRFANYTPGEPTPKLFIKNLAKGVKQEDLEYIFGRYFGTQEEMQELLQIKVMTGRHQGSAFVTFPNVELAQRAMYDIHGFVWKDKPMILVRPACTPGPPQTKQKKNKEASRLIQSVVFFFSFLPQEYGKIDKQQQ